MPIGDERAGADGAMHAFDVSPAALRDRATTGRRIGLLIAAEHVERVEASRRVIRFSDEQFDVIPGRAEGANPESSGKLGILGWIPGPALRAVPE